MTDASLSLPVGRSLDDWKPASSPLPEAIEGICIKLEPFSVSAHAASLWQAFGVDDPLMWTYMAYGPFPTQNAYETWGRTVEGKLDPLFFAVIDKFAVLDKAAQPVNDSLVSATGLIALQRIEPANGVIEIAHVAYSKHLRRSRQGSEAILRLIKHCWALGYRRIEWKCDALNAASRRAASRFGFEYEGTFRQAVVVKGRNRDTAWFSIIDSQRQKLEAAYDAWLDPANFDPSGTQRRRLADFLSE